MSNFSVISITARTSYIWWDDNEVHFVLDQHAWLGFYDASSIIKQSTCRHVTPLGHIILYLLYLLNAALWRCNKYQIYCLWFYWGLNPQSNALEISMLTITRPMRKHTLAKRKTRYVTPLGHIFQTQKLRWKCNMFKSENH